MDTYSEGGPIEAISTFFGKPDFVASNDDWGV